MKHIIAICFLLSVPVAAAVSGDPAVAPENAVLAFDPAGQAWEPNTPMGSAPLSLQREPNGRLTINLCYYAQLSCTTPSACPTCADYPGVSQISLDAWCKKLHALPIPSPQPGDQRPVCDPSWYYSP